MKSHFVMGIGAISLLFGGMSYASEVHDITAPELASFLGVSSWRTRVTLPPNTYSIDICPIEDGKIGDGLLRGQIDWSKNPDGKLTIMAGPDGDFYRLTMASTTGGTLGVSPSIPRFEVTYSPALPESMAEGVFILFVDLADRNMKGNQNDPATYKRGFVLKVTKHNE